MTIRLILADDHAILRAGLRSLLSSQADLEVVAEASTRDELVEQARIHRPDMVILDLSMPGGGLKAIEGVLKVSEATRFLALTMHDDAGHVQSALAAGVSGYLVKSADISDLATAIRAVHRGRSYLDIGLQGGALGELLAASTPTPARPGQTGARLSPREIQILRRLALGHTYRAIAGELHLSEKSVETYRSRLADKLGIRTRAGLVRYALDIGLLDESPPA